MRLKKPDIIPILLPCVIGIISAFMIFGTKGTVAVIEVDNKIVAEIELDKYEGEVDIGCELAYHNKITVHDGKIGCESADCKDNTCVKTGYIDSVGQSIICVPSRLSITIKEGG